MAIPLRRRLSALFSLRKASFGTGSSPQKRGAPCLITLEYCTQCYYKPLAAVVQQRLEEVKGIRVVVNSTKTTGAFEITAHTGGQALLLWSKLQEGLPVDSSSADQVADIVKHKLAHLLEGAAGGLDLPRLDPLSAQGILDRAQVRLLLHAAEA